jgi:hypothetical protein
MRLYVSGVAIKPGQMQLTRILSLANSIQAERAKLITPALAAQYVWSPGAPHSPAIEAVEMIEPPPTLRISVTACLIPRNKEGWTFGIPRVLWDEHFHKWDMKRFANLINNFSSRLEAQGFARINSWTIEQRRTISSELRSLRRLEFLMAELDWYLPTVGWLPARPPGRAAISTR